MKLVNDWNPTDEELIEVRLTVLAFVEHLMRRDDTDLHLFRPEDELDAFWLYLGAAQMLADVLNSITNPSPAEAVAQIRSQLIARGVTGGTS